VVAGRRPASAAAHLRWPVGGVYAVAFSADGCSPPPPATAAWSWCGTWINAPPEPRLRLARLLRPFGTKNRLSSALKAQHHSPGWRAKRCHPPNRPEGADQAAGVLAGRGGAGRRGERYVGVGCSTWAGQERCATGGTGRITSLASRRRRAGGVGDRSGTVPSPGRRQRRRLSETHRVHQLACFSACGQVGQRLPVARPRRPWPVAAPASGIGETPGRGFGSCSLAGALVVALPRRAAAEVVHPEAKPLRSVPLRASMAVICSPCAGGRVCRRRERRAFCAVARTASARAAASSQRGPGQRPPHAQRPAQRPTVGANATSPCLPNPRCGTCGITPSPRPRRGRCRCGRPHHQPAGRRERHDVCRPCRG